MLHLITLTKIHSQCFYRNSSHVSRRSFGFVSFKFSQNFYKTDSGCRTFSKGLSLSISIYVNSFCIHLLSFVLTYIHLYIGSRWWILTCMTCSTWTPSPPPTPSAPSSTTPPTRHTFKGLILAYSLPFLQSRHQFDIQTLGHPPPFLGFPFLEKC